MNSQTWPYEFPFRVAALAAIFSAFISYGAFTRVVDNLRSQRVLQSETHGLVCLEAGYAILRDVQAFDPKSVSALRNVRRESARFDAESCGAQAPGWEPIRARIYDAILRGSDKRQALAPSVVTILNSIGDRSYITYDPHPVTLNLGDTLAYALPEVQTHLFDAALAPNPLQAAKLQAAATAALSTADYDIKAALAQRPALGSLLARPMREALSSAAAYSAVLDAWENAPATRHPDRKRLFTAMRATGASVDVVYRLVRQASQREVSAELALLERRLVAIWIVYGCGLAVGVAIAWAIVSSSRRRERRALVHLHHKASQLQAELERDRAEFELGVREARFQAIFAGSPLAIAITDLQGTIVECNDSYLQLVGPAAAGRESRALLHPLLVEPPDALPNIFSLLQTGPADTHQMDLVASRNGSPIWFHALVSVIRDAQGPSAHCAVMLQDISDRKERERHLRYEATHDFLTGLPNRAFVVASLQQCVASIAALPRFSVLFLDVDDFKSINDTLGHRAGDDCLKMVAVRLTSLIREVDVVARYGGDEFIVLLTDPASVAVAPEIASRIKTAFQTPFAIGDATITVSLSAGVALDRDDYESAEHVLREADAKMYDDKLDGAKRLTTIRRLQDSVSAR